MPEWELTRGFVPPRQVKEPVKPVKLVEEKPMLKTKPVDVDEALPKRVQLVPAEAPEIKSAAPVHQDEPFMLFEEAGPGAAAIKIVHESKPAAREEYVKQALPVSAHRIEHPADKKKVEPGVVVKQAEEPVFAQRAEHPVQVKKMEPAANETADEKAERIKREAVARVRARFGMSAEVIEALAIAMQKPESGAARVSAAAPAAMEKKPETITPAADVQAPVEAERFEPSPAIEKMQLVMSEVPMQPVATPVSVAAKPLQADLPPVRRVTVPQERQQTKAMPAAQWALQPERRRAPREPIVFPRGLNKAALRMSEKGQAIARGQAGPSLTAAEQAIAKKISSAHHPVAAKPSASRASNVEPGGRWNLLRRFGAFDSDEQDSTSLAERAAG